MARLRGVADAQSEWWEQWRRSDYSWAGLAKHRLFGWSVRRNGRLVRDQDAPKTAKPATLQDLWRTEASRLIVDVDGDSWTAVHAPLLTRSGKPLKSSWAQLDLDRIDEAIRAAANRLPDDLAASLSGDPTSSRARWPLVLDGAVLSGRLPALADLPFLEARRIAFDNFDFKDGLGQALLRTALFIRPVTLLEGTLNARIMRAIFVRGVSLMPPLIERFVLSTSEVFGAFTVDEVQVTAEVRVSTSVIADDVKVSEVNGGRFVLAHARVAGSVKLDMVESEALQLQGSHIEGDLEIQNSSAPRTTAGGLRVDGDVRLHHVAAARSFDFSRTRIFGRFETTGLDIHRGDFSDTSFAETAAFRAARFDGPVSFERAHFAKTAYFNGASFSPKREDVSSTFRGARFDDFLDFSGVGPLTFAAFDGARFKAEVRFGVATFEKGAAFKAALAGATDDDLRSLEHGLRSLKQAAEAIRDRTAEQIYFRYELIARRRRRAGRSCEEFALSWLYGLTSNYGSSFLRPLGAALGLWVLFAAIYLFLGAIFGEPAVKDIALTGGAVHPAVPEALNLSARSMFNLFGVWAQRPVAGAVGLEAELLHQGVWSGFVTRVASSVQSVLAGVLLFLVALAARRRFQIN